MSVVSRGGCSSGIVVVCGVLGSDTPLQVVPAGVWAGEKEGGLLPETLY